MGFQKLEEIWPRIICFYPFYGTDGINGTKAVLVNGQVHLDKRKTKTVLEAMARIFAADLTALRNKYRGVVGHKGLVPLPLHRSLVLIPFRVRRVQYKDHGATGYAVLNKVQGVEATGVAEKEKISDHNGVAASRIRLSGGVYFDCMERAATVKKRLAEGAQVLQEYSRFHLDRDIPVHQVMNENFTTAGESKVVYHIHYHGGALSNDLQAFRLQTL